MPQMTNPVTGKTVSVAAGNTGAYSAVGWTQSSNASSAGFAGSSQAAPVPPAGSYIINPGSTWQTYNPNTGQTSYGAPPAGFAAGVAQGVSAPATATTAGLSSGYVWNGSDYVPLTAATGYTQPNPELPASAGGYAMGAKPQGSIVSGTVPSAWKYITGDTTKKDSVADYASLLASYGFTSADYSKYIIKNADGKMYYSPPPIATITSPTGEKKVVGVGTQAAANLLSKGWNLGTAPKATTAITPGSMTGGAKITTGTTGAGSLADQTAAGLTEYSTGLEKQLADEKAQADAAKKEKDTFQAQISSLMGTSKSEASMQAEAEAAAGIAAKQAAVAAQNTLLKTKLAEINSLTASYELQNTVEEGKVTTLSRMQGAQAQNYKMYLAQKNLLTSEASLIQATALGLQGELEAAQTAVNRAVDLKYADQQFQINIKLKQLEFLQADLDEENAEYAAVLERQYKLQDMALGQKMDYEKMDYGLKLDIITKYGVGSTTDTIEQLRAKMVKSPIWIEENKPKSTGTGTADNYFTRPKADGTIGYYFGNEKQPATAQEISADAYNQGLGKDGGTVYDDSYIARQTAQYIASDGTVDWEGINTLQNVDKGLWNKVRDAANNYLNETEKPAATTEQPVSDIEKRIQLKQSRGEDASQIKYELGQEGFNQNDINKSSVANLIDKDGAAVSGFFSNLF